MIKKLIKRKNIVVNIWRNNLLRKIKCLKMKNYEFDKLIVHEIQNLYQNESQNSQKLILYEL